uniref:Photosystem I 4 kDa hydrophobic subunit n=1 Tax=Phacus inflexus TaxID=461210 RepID=A0A3G3LKV3_9EUGL|nr:photosystem I 4 kDa hydrophobic subunit [Phacus inflexus]AYQ93343.1 photosystem I 4 kDa hydrophobic subunit [Phacus inflexus]
MTNSFISSFFVPLVGFLTPLLIVIFFLRYADQEVID